METEIFPPEPYNIDPTNFNKRLRVLGGWLLKDIIDDLNETNSEFHYKTFLKQCDHLALRYPLHEELNHIEPVRLLFKKMFRYKMLNIKRRQITSDLKRLNFL